jgi:hypothetical protein
MADVGGKLLKIISTVQSAACIFQIMVTITVTYSPPRCQKKIHVTVISPMLQIQNFGRHVTRNMACRIDQNGTVFQIYPPDICEVRLLSNNATNQHMSNHVPIWPLPGVNHCITISQTKSQRQVVDAQIKNPA